MAKRTVRAIDARKMGKISQAKFEALVKENGIEKGRAYPIEIEA